jgi:hypothetical protein
VAAGSNQKLHGKNGAIYIGGPKGSGIKVTSKTEWTLNLGRDYVDSTVFGDVNKTYLVGLRDVQGQFAGLLDTSGDIMINQTTSDAVDIYLYADDTNLNPTGQPILIAFGPGLVDGSITAANNDAIKATGNFRAAGAWSVFTSGTLS